MTIDQAVGDTSWAVEAVRHGPIALAESGSERLEIGRQSIAANHARIKRWINGAAAALRVVLV